MVAAKAGVPANASFMGVAEEVYRPASRRSRISRIAFLRDSRSVRSRIKTPSRWSISCSRQRASSRGSTRGVTNIAPLERRAAPPIRGALVCNLGDMLDRQADDVRRSIVAGAVLTGVGTVLDDDPRLV